MRLFELLTIIFDVLTVHRSDTYIDFFFKCSIIPFYLHINDRENKVKFDFSTQKIHQANSINLKSDSMAREGFKN